jgi:hypothetical protein
MLMDESLERITKSVAVCNKHKSYLIFALEQLSGLFPITLAGYENLTKIQVTLLDQMIFRFAKLQDTIGKRLFKELLEYLGEETENVSFRDLLLRLEKLQIIPSASEWLEFREIRNIVSHEYPEDNERLIEGLNVLFSRSSQLISIYDGIVNYLQTFFPEPISHGI